MRRNAVGSLDPVWISRLVAKGCYGRASFLGRILIVLFWNASRLFICYALGHHVCFPMSSMRWLDNLLVGCFVATFCSALRSDCQGSCEFTDVCGAACVTEMADCDSNPVCRQCVDDFFTANDEDTSDEDTAGMSCVDANDAICALYGSNATCTSNNEYEAYLGEELHRSPSMHDGISIFRRPGLAPNPPCHKSDDVERSVSWFIAIQFCCPASWHAATVERDNRRTIQEPAAFLARPPAFDVPTATLRTP